MAKVPAFDKSLEKANVWIAELAAELETDDMQEAYRVLRAFLHALRDRLTVDEAAQLAAQLPTLVRGVYYEGWDPSRTPLPQRHLSELLDRIATDALLAGETEASFAAGAASRVLHRHVSAGELEDVLAVLPVELRPIAAG